MKVALPIGLKIGESVVTEVELNELDGFSRQIVSDKDLRKNPSRMTTALIKHCSPTLTEEQIRSMFIPDRNSMLMDLQKMSIGNELKAKYVCKWCDKGFETIEDLGQLKFTQWNEWRDSVSVSLPKGYTDREGVLHQSVVIGLPTGADEEVLTPVLERNYGEWCNALLARKIRSFGTLDMEKFAGLGIKIIQKLSLKDVDTLVKAITDNAPGYALGHMVTCPSCNRESNQILDMTYFF